MGRSVAGEMAARTASVNVKALNAERLGRAQARMREADLPAALLFDPANTRYVACDGQFLVANLHCSYRWALVFADDDPILWDGADQMHVSRSRWDGDIRKASGFTFFGSGPNSRRDARTAIAEVVAELRARGLEREPLGVDRAETVAFLELAAQGIAVVDAVPILEDCARGEDTPRARNPPRERAVGR